MKIVKYDDASWHYGGTYSSDLPPEAAATHIGMFLAWCLLQGMGSDELRDDYGPELKKLATRKLTPGGVRDAALASGAYGGMGETFGQLDEVLVTLA